MVFTDTQTWAYVLFLLLKSLEVQQVVFSLSLSFLICEMGMLWNE